MQEPITDPANTDQCWTKYWTASNFAVGYDEFGGGEADDDAGGEGDDDDGDDKASYVTC